MIWGKRPHSGCVFAKRPSWWTFSPWWCGHKPGSNHPPCLFLRNLATCFPEDTKAMSGGSETIYTVEYKLSRKRIEHIFWGSIGDGSILRSWERAAKDVPKISHTWYMGNKCQITTSHHHSSHTHEQRTNKMRIRADVYIKTMASRVMIGECGAPNDAPRESSCCMSLCVATSCVPIHALTGLHDELLQSPRDLKYCNTASALWSRSRDKSLGSNIGFLVEPEHGVRRAPYTHT